MKKVLGIILAIVFALLFWVALTWIFYTGGVGLVLSILLPPGCALGALALVALVDLIVNLIDS